MNDLDMPDLTTEQVEELCAVAEEAARKHVLSRVSSKKVETLNISVEAEGANPLTLIVDIDLVLSPSMENFDTQKLADEAVTEAFATSEKYLRNLTCHSQK